MTLKEYELQVNDFNEFTRFLNLFAVLQPTAQMTIKDGGIEIFGKFLSGRCDLFSTAISLSPLALEKPANGITVFFADLKKFIYTLGILGRYYDLSDNSPFLTKEITLHVAADASYIRIASRKYTIKYQLSSNAVVRSTLGDAATTVLPPSKYAAVAHNAYAGGKSIIDEIQPLLAFKTGKKRIGNIAPLLSTLASSDNVMIKLEIPEQVAIETDLGGEGNGGKAFVVPNTMYAVISDTQRLIATKLGNKVCVEVGNITNLASEYKEHCRVDSLKENFVFLMTIDQLKLISTLVSSFAPPEVKAPKPKKGKKGAPAEEEPTIQPQIEDTGIEIGISKVNLMHLNLISAVGSVTSEFYISMIGNKPE